MVRNLRGFSFGSRVLQEDVQTWGREDDVSSGQRRPSRYLVPTSGTGINTLVRRSRGDRTSASRETTEFEAVSTEKKGGTVSEVKSVVSFVR